MPWGKSPVITAETQWDYHQFFPFKERKKKKVKSDKMKKIKKLHILPDTKQESLEILSFIIYHSLNLDEIILFDDYRFFEVF